MVHAVRLFSGGKKGAVRMPGTTSKELVERLANIPVMSGNVRPFEFWYNFGRKHWFDSQFCLFPSPPVTFILAADVHFPPHPEYIKHKGLTLTNNYPTMAAKLLNLLAVTSLAIVACSFGATPANALSANHNAHAAKSHLARAHGTMSKKKRSTNAKRCKTRPASSSLVASSTKADTSSTKVATSTKPADVQATTSSKKATSTKAPAATTAPAAPAPAVNSGNGKVGIAWANSNDIAIKPFKGPNSGWYFLSFHFIYLNP